MFIGRELELKQLQRLQRLNKASLVVCRGRRRIGKSTLIEHFGESFEHFYEFQGLAPRDDISNNDQLDSFALQLAKQQGLPSLSLDNWHSAFSLLFRLTQDQEVLIFLDEISWMASRDADFVGQLKIAWDTHFKKNRRLILVLCGSVSSWIDQNILNSADFLGRVSLSLDLRELSLSQCTTFMNTIGGPAGQRLSTLEKFRLLCVTGGVPRYLEEIDYSATAEQNITDLCFRRGGILVSEYDKIFNDIFAKRAKKYRELIELLADQSLEFSEVCARLGVEPSGVTSEYLADLEACGFLERDYVYSIKTGQRGKFSRYRLKDNYLRFYLKYIEPVKDKIEAGLYDTNSVTDFSAYRSILGLQFENLILNNLPEVINTLSINAAQVISASPYFQRKTQRQDACQIDLLIDTEYAIYVCEIKLRAKIDAQVITQMDEKIRRLKVDKSKSVRRVLIYAGELAPSIQTGDAFDQIIGSGDFLDA